MLELLALLGAVPGKVQPRIDAPKFQCTPAWYHKKTGTIGCQSDLQIALWGVKFVNPSKARVPESYYSERLTSILRANSVRSGTPGYFYVLGAPEMSCYSEDSEKRRVAQCFVDGLGVFGGADLGCALIRSGITQPRRFARDEYSICLIGAVNIEYEDK